MYLCKLKESIPVHSVLGPKVISAFFLHFKLIYVVTNLFLLSLFFIFQYQDESLSEDALLQDDDEEDDDNESRSWRR